jgi:hypothetical protein
MGKNKMKSDYRSPFENLDAMSIRRSLSEQFIRGSSRPKGTFLA